MRVPVGTVLERRGGRHILKGVPFAPDLWQPFLKYVDLLYWAELEESQQNRWTIPFAEGVLDFELLFVEGFASVFGIDLW